jgi:multidrug efflux system membrane fusion protein
MEPFGPMTPSFLRPAARACLLCLAPLLAGAPAAVAQTARPPSAIPVTVAPATRHDVPVYAAGLGTVTALNSALIRARVDGTLDQITFTEGQDVKQGDLLAIIDPRPYQAVLDQAIARRAQDFATLTNAQRDLARYNTLANGGYASRQQAETQSAAVQGGQSQIAADQAAIEAAALNLSFTHITAPIDGRVGLRQINPGNLVHATDSQGIVLITQLHPIGVLFTLPEEAVPDIADAMHAGPAPTVQAVDSETGRLLDSGTLLTADNTISTATGTITLKAVFPNTENRLWPGEFLRARIKLRTLANVVTIPARAVQRGQDGLYVFVADPTGHAEQRPVQEYQEQDGTAAIQSGLKPGELVVTDGESRVSNGALLDIHPADS